MRPLQFYLLLSTAGAIAVCRNLNTQQTLHVQEAQTDYWPVYFDTATTLRPRGLRKKSTEPRIGLAKRHSQMVPQEQAPTDASMEAMDRVEEQILRQFHDVDHRYSERKLHMTTSRISVYKTLDQLNTLSRNNPSRRKLVRRGACFTTLCFRRKHDRSPLDPVHIYGNPRVARSPSESSIALSPFAAYSVQHPGKTSPKQHSITRSSAPKSKPSEYKE